MKRYGESRLGTVQVRVLMVGIFVALMPMLAACGGAEEFAVDESDPLAWSGADEWLGPDSRAAKHATDGSQERQPSAVTSGEN